MLNKLRDAMQRFFYGRHGMDDLGQFTFIVYMVLFVLNLLTRNAVFYYVELIIVFLFLYRCLSKNLTKRQEENRKYMEFKNKFLRFFRIQKRRWTDRKTHVYRTCPHCRTTVRLPKIKGTHTTTCPKCRKDFDVKV
ncbi:MAG: hypothetical protein Q4F83_13170 [Eubacteriales bacterium]|nr:hypothetical protein [Eubacteriales bacterium]